MLSPDLQRLYEDWCARAKSGIPRRRDFDPLDLRYILGRLSILEVHHNPLRFFYRLHGTDSARRIGFDQTNKFIEDAPDKSWISLARGNLEQVVASGGIPLVTRRFDQMYGGRLWNVEVLVLPLSSDGTVLNMLFSGVAHYASGTWADGRQQRSETQWLASPIAISAA